MTYRRRSTPLHAARPGVAAAYCLALAVLALVFEHPLVLAALLVTVAAAARAARVGAELRRAALLAVPLGLAVAAINPLVSREGLTVVLRGGELPVLGRLDVTLEAIAYGGVLGLRAVAIVLAFALASACVDPDVLVRAVRRVSARSALSAAVAARLAPLLATDARRMAEAQRCRPGPPPARAAVLRAVAANALDRAVDVAATLELRGYALPAKPARRPARWSRHDFAFAAATLALLGAGAVALLADAAAFTAYPRLAAAAGPGAVGLALALPALALAPFADARGVAPAVPHASWGRTG